MENLQGSEEVEVDIIGLSSKGLGVGKDLRNGSGMTYFIAGTIPGERVIAQVFLRDGPHAKANIVQVVSKSPSRVVPPCPYVPACGGCSIQHIVYDRQLVEKKALVKRFLSPVISNLSSIISPIIAASHALGSRSRGRFHVSRKDGSQKLGLHAQESSDVIDIESCLALDSRIDEALQWVRKWWLDEFPDGASVNAVLDEVKDRVLVAVSLPGDSTNRNVSIELPDQVPPLWLSLQVGERKEGAYFYPINRDRPLRFAPEVFTQSDVISNRVLVQEVLKAANPLGSDTVLDLFCGIGNFSLPFAKLCKSVEGVDGSRRSIEIAKSNGTKWGCKNIEFFKNDVLFSLNGITKKGKQFDIVLLDPPRIGIGKDIQLLEGIATKRIIYISCNPKSLANDISFLKLFKPVLVQPIDMFPQTMHVETVVVLEPLHSV